MAKDTTTTHANAAGLKNVLVVPEGDQSWTATNGAAAGDQSSSATQSATDDSASPKANQVSQNEVTEVSQITPTNNEVADKKSDFATTANRIAAEEAGTERPSNSASYTSTEATQTNSETQAEVNDASQNVSAEVSEMAPKNDDLADERSDVATMQNGAEVDEQPHPATQNGTAVDLTETVESSETAGAEVVAAAFTPMPDELTAAVVDAPNQVTDPLDFSTKTPTPASQEPTVDLIADAAAAPTTTDNAEIATDATGSVPVPTETPVDAEGGTTAETDSSAIDPRTAAEITSPENNAAAALDSAVTPRNESDSSAQPTVAVDVTAAETTTTSTDAQAADLVNTETAEPIAENPTADAVDESATPAETTVEQYLDHNQKATGSFIRNIFRKKKKVSQPSTTTTASQSREAEKIYQQGLASVRDLISPSSLEIHYDHLQLSGVLVRSFFVYAYPRYLETNWLSPVVNFDATVDMAQFIYPIQSAEIMRTLRKKVAQIQSSITMAREKGNVRDPMLETALEDAEQLRTDLQRGQEKFFQFGFYFTIYAEDKAKLDATTKMLENQLGGKLVLTKRADIQGEHAFNSTLPLCLDELNVFRNMNTSPLSTTFPFVSSSLASDDGILYGLNRHNNSLIIFDRFKLPNANSVVFASSGAGKSYAVKLEILRQAMLGVDVIVIDPENEYQTLTETIGGTYLRVSLNSDQRINPFDLPMAFEDQQSQPGDLLRENIITLTGLIKLMLGKMSATEEALIDKALIDTYAVRGITMEREDPGGIPPPTMEDFYSVLSHMKGAEDIAQRLQKYTTGTFGGIFNKPTNVNLNSGVVVFCIRDLEDQLRPTAMYILLNYIWNRVRSKMKKRLLVIDEAWTMMQHEDAARFLFGLVKRARKYYLGITAVTQDVEDFLGSPYGRPVVTNSSMQLLMKQAPSSMEILQKTFNLTDGEKYMLLNSGVGQGLFFADNKHVAVQVIASYSENQIVTTNPEELLAQRQQKERA